MTPFEFDRYLADQDRVAEAVVHVDRLDAGDGTLMLGYRIDRSTLHVYLEDGEIHAVTYVGGFDGIRFTNWVHGPSLAADELMPSKRAYPQHTNHRFACVMRELGHPLPFTSFDDTNAFGTFRRRASASANTVTGRTVVLNSGTNGWSACGETTETFAVGIPAAVTQVAAPSIAPGAVMTDSITISDLGPAATAAVEFQVFNLTDDAACAAPLDFDGTGPLGITVTENGLAAGTTAGLADLIVPAAAAGDRLGYRERIVSITVGGSTAPFAGAWSACGEAITVAANTWALAHGLPTVTVSQVEEIEHLACGHSDYGSKLALYVAELVYGLRPRP